MAVSDSPRWASGRAVARPFAAQPLIGGNGVNDLNGRDLEIEDGGALPREPVRRVPRRRDDGGNWNRSLAQMTAVYFATAQRGSYAADLNAHV